MFKRYWTCSIKIHNTHTWITFRFPCIHLLLTPLYVPITAHTKLYTGPQSTGQYTHRSCNCKWPPYLRIDPLENSLSLRSRALVVENCLKLMEPAHFALLIFMPSTTKEVRHCCNPLILRTSAQITTVNKPTSMERSCVAYINKR